MSRPRKATIEDVASAIVAAMAQDLPTDAESIAGELDIRRSTLHEVCLREAREPFSTFRERFRTLPNVVQLLIDDDGLGRLGIVLPAAVRSGLLRRAAASRTNIHSLVAEAVIRYLEDTSEPHQAA